MLNPDVRLYDFLPPDVRDKVDEMFIATRNKSVWRIKTFQSRFTKRTYTYREALNVIKKFRVGREVYYMKNLDHYAFKLAARKKNHSNKELPDNEFVRLANAFSTSIPEIEQVIKMLLVSENTKRYEN